ncbi:MAG: hypothetical protein AAF439_09850, partial [Pseudomonadota bacterium]
MTAATAMKELIDHAPEAMEPEEGAACDLETARIPHIAVHVFRETDAFADVWMHAAEDRRMVSASTTIFGGGFPAAIAKYVKEATP